MATITLVDARNELIELFDVAVEKANAIPEVRGPLTKVLAFNDTSRVPESPAIPGIPLAPMAPWARLSIRHSGGQSTSISQRRYINRGSIFVNVFVPKTTTDAAHRAQIIAQCFNAVFKEHRGSVDLRSIRYTDVPPDAAYFGQDVLAEFEWREFRRR